ncbi:MAG: VacB/RNase II family 3'-5' exoribonuclease [Adlercreutzia caecimuris]|uniref:ribonuclease R family protein n=1 Tax=Adlercreutzia caecimuris TaxID=671266 RepID=UPI00242FDB17|nr:VacB/RNase II family 3'-5' exoribonuclease [Adlercreutzia caecimuris]MCI9206948.1 VacB/RNase II family 3'-5' exoribonuclease [Adlercreutzia caecimuris]
MAKGRKAVRRKPKANPTGVLVSRAEGYGFVATAEGEYFVPHSAMAGAFDGDLVELAPISRKGASKGDGRAGTRAGAAGEGAGLPAARVLRVIDRAHDTVVGRYEVAEPFGVVVPADPRIPYDVFTLRSDYPDVPDGALVRVRIAQFPTRKSAATGHIEEVIADAADEVRVGVDLIVARHKLETVFSDGALAEAAAAVLDAEGALVAGYRDLTERFVFTIDPADAKDFDDALSLDYLEDERLWRLGVHIADVSHYVPWNSSVDLDARRRATSVYLADRVIPMLPPALSDELCSLKPGEVRRSMTADLYLNDAGEFVRADFYPALIRSDARLAYNEADAILLDYKEAVAVGGDLAWRLVQCSRLAGLREAARTRAGGIDFATTEAKVALDGEGRPVDIVLRRKTDATRLVEEAMILANEAVAGCLETRGFPCLFRVHEPPAADALGSLIPVFQEFPWFTRPMEARLVAGDARTIQEILAASADRSEGELVSSLLLRAMKRAVYRPDNLGHYGLASEAYCHFTSPIRRYPDLVVHRMLRAALTRRPEKFDQEVAALPWIAEHSSDMERVADTAARQSQELKMAEYLSAFTGQAFSGVVSGVASYGLYVRLDCTAEGILPVRALGEEYFAFDPVRYTLTGEESGRAFRLGQRVPVVLKSVDVPTATLEFALAGSR